MSDSRRKHPVLSITCSDSEKYDKKVMHKRLRAYAKDAIRRGVEDAILLPREREVSNVWCWAKDGKCWYHKDDIAWLDEPSYNRPAWGGWRVWAK